MSQLRMIPSYLFLVVIFLFLAFWAGCGAVEWNSPGGKLGEYRYIYREYYIGPPIRTIPIWIDRSFSESDRASIDKAVKHWNFALNGYIELNIVDINFGGEEDKLKRQEERNGWLFLRINSQDENVPKQDNPKYYTIGFVEKIGGNYMYLVRDRLTDSDIFGVTMHEIGHLLGSGHKGDHLMYPYHTLADSQCIDWVSLNEVAKYQGLPIKQLNYCVDLDSDIHDEGGVRGGCGIGL